MNALKSMGRGSSLRASLMRGLAWTTIGFAGSQVLRLASNLFMTRLLAPEHFGLMAIVTVVMIGLAMFSDIGLGPAVVRSPSINDEGFLNTAWTMQIGRGLLIQAACCVVAIPAAHFYKEPQLVYLIPVAGLGILIGSFAPMQLQTLQRTMRLGKLIGIDLITQASALIVMVVAGYTFKSIWVLVFGGLVGNILRTVAYWRVLPVHSHRIAWVSVHAHELLRFGGWIFLSTILYFAGSSTGSLVLGKLATMDKVGLFAIATTLAKSAEQMYEQISSRIIFPVYSAMVNNGSGNHRSHIFKIRLGMVSAFVPIMCAAAYFAEPIVRLMLDPRYARAAWIFQVTLMGLVPSIISNTLPYLVARGSSMLSACFSGARALGCIALVMIGHAYGGEDGVIIGIACLPSLMYLLDYCIQRCYGLSDFRIDFAALSIWAFTGLLICNRYY